jgi:hypothetical protein
MLHLTNAASVLGLVEKVPAIEMVPIVGCGCGGIEHNHTGPAPSAEDILADNNFLGDL